MYNKILYHNQPLLQGNYIHFFDDAILKTNKD